MTAVSKMTRRIFLRTLFFLCLCGPLRLTSALAKLDSSDSRDLLSLKLASFFRHRESAGRVGLEYLRYVPMEADAHLLTDLICSSQGERRLELAQADTRKLRELLQRQQRQDFEQGRTVNVDGWILSETEARLCALAALV